VQIFGTSVYEAFQMEIGLNGNILTRSFPDLEHLATHSWFKILWHYASTYDVKINFHQRFHIPPTRLNDISIVEFFLRNGISGTNLEILNCVRKFFHVHSLADILRADGTTIDTIIFSRRPLPSLRTFSWEKPTLSDFDFWESTLRSLVAPSLRRLQSLGHYTSEPHIPYHWFASNDEELVYHVFSPDGYNVYQRSHDYVTTRSGPRFDKISTLPGQPPTTNYASISNYASSHINLHSTCPSYTPSTNTSSLLPTLFSISDSSLWSNLEVDGDGSWLINSINSESLDICNDGSYMPDLSCTACSGAFILRCRDSGQEIRGCFTDNSTDSDNYRGELLGSIGPLLLIRAAFMSCHDTSLLEDASVSTIQLHCDNRGVVLHGNDPHGPLKDGQKQADLVRLLKSYSRLIPCKTEWVHIKGHSDDHLSFSELSPLQQLNVRCDQLAKKILRQCISNNSFTTPIFPDEDIVIAVSSTKVQSSVKSSIYKHWGKTTARELFS
jgi:hypothetical protein